MTPFPIIAANENALEFDSMLDVGEAEDNGTSLFQRSVMHLIPANNREGHQLTLL
jgi:hypothetical protein